MRYDGKAWRNHVRDSWIRHSNGEVEFEGELCPWANMTLGQRITWHRVRNGWSQVELAIRADTCQSAIGRYERDDEACLRIHTLRKIANALGVCCGELLD